MKRKSALVGLIAVAACTGTAWTLWPRAESANPGLGTAKVVRRDFASLVLATGAVRPKVGAEVRVGARISGKVERLHANIGDVVNKGQVIAELEKAELKAIVAQREAELRLAEAKLSAAGALRGKEIEKVRADVSKWEATLRLARKELDREDGLLKRHSTSQQARDRAEERMAVAEAERNAVRKALELAQARLEEEVKQAQAEVERAIALLTNAKARLAYATITAPISGAIGSVATQEGETVAAGLNAPTFVTIIDLDRLQVDAFVDEVDIGKIKVGQGAVFTVDAFPGREFQGKVGAIYPQAVIQENVVNYDVVIEIAGAYTGLLRPEMTASVTILLDARKDVLAIPVKAVKRERGRSIVYTLGDGQAHRREVKVGWKDGPWVEVVGGLDEGQAVLLGPPPPQRTEP